MAKADSNLDRETVAGFGQEWSTFRQGEDFADADRADMFAGYFGIFPWSDLPPNAAGIDVGCGSGRWAQLVRRASGICTCSMPAPRPWRWQGKI
jgi:hypothetical protein